MSTLRTTKIIHGSSAIDNIVLDNQGRAIFGPNSTAGKAALYVNAQNNRVGVNTETPSVELDVDGQISATGNATVGGTLSVTGNVNIDSGTLFIDTVNNRVGINTSTPTYTFEVLGSSLAAKIGSSARSLYFTPDSNGIGLHVQAGQSNAGVYFNETSDQLWLQTGGTTRLAISDTGRVGIGMLAATPIAQLHLVRPLDDTVPVFATGESAGIGRLAIYQETGYTGNRLDSGNIDLKLRTVLIAGTGGNIIFETGPGAGNATEAARFSNAGYFGVNDPTPACHISAIGNIDTVYDERTPSISDCVIACSNQPSSEIAGAMATIQFSVNGGIQNRVCAIGAVAMSATSRYTDLFFATDDSGSRKTKAKITWRGDFNMSPNTGANGQLLGGIGAVTTNVDQGGTLDWNDSTNARSGNGYSLLLGTATNGPGSGNYFHAFSFEYASKGGQGNLSQWAIGYNVNARYMRTRFSGVWSSWVAF